jgi:hypothetical protein
MIVYCKFGLGRTNSWPVSRFCAGNYEKEVDIDQILTACLYYLLILFGRRQHKKLILYIIFCVSLYTGERATRENGLGRL